MDHASQFETLARAAMAADAHDPPALAALHEQLDTIAAALNATDPAPLHDAVDTGRRLLTSLLLRETDDPEGALALVRRSIEEILSCLPDRAPASARSDEENELLAAWVAGCTDALSRLEAAILATEDASSTTAADDARRIIHTIKGEAGVLSLDAVRRAAHDLESAIEIAESGPDGFPAEAALAFVDWMKSAVEVLDGGGSSLPPDTSVRTALARLQADDGGTGDGTAAASGKPGVPDAGGDGTLAEFVSEAREHLACAESNLLRLEAAPDDPEPVNAVFRAFHTIKGVAGFLGLDLIVRIAHGAETLLDRARADRTFRMERDALDVALAAGDLLGRLLDAVDGSSVPPRAECDALLERLDAVLDGRTTPPPPAAAATAGPVGAGSTGTGSAGAGPAGAGSPRRMAEQTVKVSTSRLDTLLTMVSELVIAQQMIIHDPAVRAIAGPRLQSSVAQATKIIRNLHDLTMSLRMVTVRSTFQKMARLVRDIAARSGKQITLVTEGEETEFDRTVIEEIGDPLVHLVRNACDHGIESPAERIACGKAPTGRLTIRACHQGGSVIVEIEDDGRGLDRDRILRTAIERGLLAHEQCSAGITDREVWQLIFLPGFSTAAEVTDLSGRGVGMDVVRRNIERVRGTIEIHSAPGSGTRFRFSLPLTMAIIDGMVVRVGAGRFVLPTLAIEQCMRPVAARVTAVAGRGDMAVIRGELLPVYRLGRVLGLRGSDAEPVHSLLLVLDTPHGRCCVIVDEILGQQQVVIKSLDPSMPVPRSIAGGAILGDGRIALILDPAGLVAEAADSDA